MKSKRFQNKLGNLVLEPTDEPVSKVERLLWFYFVHDIEEPFEHQQTL